MTQIMKSLWDKSCGRLQRKVSSLKHKLFETKAIVLAYHRVADLEFDPLPIAVSPKNFQEHLSVLQCSFRATSLRSLRSSIESKFLPSMSVVLTFDDGYADNLHEAKHLLEKFDIPATVFVTAGAVKQEREFWWDELDHILLNPSILPPELNLSIGDKEYCWALENGQEYTETQRNLDRHWNTLNLMDLDRINPRYRIYIGLLQLLKPLSEDDRQHTLSTLRTWAGYDPIVRETHQTLSPQELQDLAKGGLVEIGAHTVTHPSLATLDAAAQQVEIQQSKLRLEALIGQPITSFAYPFGSLSDYTPETVELVRNSGFELACSNYEGRVTKGCDWFQIPRFLVRNWDGDEFERRLREWLA